MDKVSLGRKGEGLAMKYLESKDYELVEKNYGRYTGEIDIIAKKDEILVFIEVKTRNSKEFGQAYESVNLKKQEKIKKTSLLYLQEKNIFDIQLRYDIIEIYFNEYMINHIENAF